MVSKLPGFSDIYEIIKIYLIINDKHFVKQKKKAQGWLSVNSTWNTGKSLDEKGQS